MSRNLLVLCIMINLYVGTELSGYEVCIFILRQCLGIRTRTFRIFNRPGQRYSLIILKLFFKNKSEMSHCYYIKPTIHFKPSLCK